MIANNLTPSEPTHPGEILREDIECRGITQTKLAEAALGIDADFWINLQNDYSTDKAKQDSSFMAKPNSTKQI